MKISECIGCREIKEVDKNEICQKCREWEAKHLDELRRAEDEDHTCSQCGYVGVAIDKHHVHGRKNSDVTIIVCCNCHREIHRGTREIRS